MENKKEKLNRTTVDLFAFGILLMFVFIILKLAHILPLDWVWITAPFWMSIVLAMAASLFKSIINDIKVWEQNRKRK